MDMSIFSFEIPTKIIFGQGCLNELHNQLSELGAARPLIVTDAGVASAGVLGKVLAVLPAVASYRVFDGVEANPKDRNVAAGAGMYKGFGGRITRGFVTCSFY